jgi:DNA-binding phage protein
VTKHLLDENDVPKHLLDENDVLRLLHEVVDRAGGQSAWARQTGVDRVYLNKVLRGKRPISPKILQALKLKKVYAPTRPP